MLLLEPAIFSTDILIALKSSCEVPLAPFSVSGEYTRFVPANGRDWRLLAELLSCSSEQARADHHLCRRQAGGGAGLI